jgi:hypothetical protein
MNNISRLLFVGNSYIFRNDLPGLITQMAPCAVESQSIVAGGASLRRHINSGAVITALGESEWDFVVLQEQSTLPLKNAARFGASVRELDELIRAHGARTALYQTWARQNAPESQNALSDEYAKLATELGALLVPVGTAWQDVLQKRPNATLFDPDGSHPTPLGSYLAACVFVATLWKTDPRGLEMPQNLKIDAADAEFVQNAAWQAAKV